MLSSLRTVTIAGSTGIFPFRSSSASPSGRNLNNRNLFYNTILMPSKLPGLDFYTRFRRGILHLPSCSGRRTSGRQCTQEQTRATRPVSGALLILIECKKDYSWLHWSFRIPRISDLTEILADSIRNMPGSLTFVASVSYIRRAG